MDNLTLGSLFDGSGGFPLGGMLAGITPVWASEIEPFPIRVTTKRLPNVKHLGDISTINGADIEPVDIITFGSPCTDMSVAGKRAGLDGQQSVLFYQAIRIVKEMRCKTNGKYPRFIVWENVPGAFSSNKGEDFKAVLDAVCKVKSEGLSVPMPESGKWSNAGNIVADDFSLAWRVFDAQYWGVPQRRKRIYLVADFAGGSAGKILFESEGLSGYSSQSIFSRQGTAGTSEGGSFETGYGIDGYNGAVDDVAATLGINCGVATGRNGVIVLNDQGGNRMDVTEDMTCTLRAKSTHPPLVFENHSQDSRYVGPLETAQTVLATFGTGGNNQPLVVSSPQAYGVCSKDSNAMKSDNPDSGFYKADTSRTLDGNGGNLTCNQGGIAVVENVGTFDVRFTSEGTQNARSNIYPTELARTIDTGGNAPDSNQGGVAVVAVQGSMIGRADENGPQGCGYDEDVSFTLNTTDRHAVAYGIDRSAFNQGQNALYNITIDAERQPTMVAKGPGAVAQPVSFYPQMKAESQSYREGISNTLVNGTNPGYQNGVIVPTYAMTTGDFMQCNEEIVPTLTARDYKDPPVALRCDASMRRFGGNCADIVSAPTVNDTDEIKYIVRRLTPTECARLQGFPDWWCKNLGTENPTEEEIQFWEKVFETHRRVMGTATKPKTRKQILKWLSAPYSDSAEYKMWGNGVALPCVYFVLSGIVYYAHEAVN